MTTPYAWPNKPNASPEPLGAHPGRFGDVGQVNARYARKIPLETPRAVRDRLNRCSSNPRPTRAGWFAPRLRPSLLRRPWRPERRRGPGSPGPSSRTASPRRAPAARGNRRPAPRPARSPARGPTRPASTAPVSSPPCEACAHSSQNSAHATTASERGLGLAGPVGAEHVQVQARAQVAGLDHVLVARGDARDERRSGPPRGRDPPGPAELGRQARPPPPCRGSKQTPSA